MCFLLTVICIWVGEVFCFLLFFISLFLVHQSVHSMVHSIRAVSMFGLSQLLGLLSCLSPPILLPSCPVSFFCLLGELIHNVVTKVFRVTCTFQLNVDWMSRYGFWYCSSPMFCWRLCKLLKFSIVCGRRSSLNPNKLLIVFEVHFLAHLPSQFVLMASFVETQIRVLIMHVFSSCHANPHPARPETFKGCSTTGVKVH